MSCMSPNKMKNETCVPCYIANVDDTFTDLDSTERAGPHKKPMIA